MLLSSIEIRYGTSVAGGHLLFTYLSGAKCKQAYSNVISQMSYRI